MCNPPLLGSLIVRKIVCTIPSLVYSSHWALQYLFLLCQSVLFCPSPARQTQLEHKSFLMASCRTWLWIFFPFVIQQIKERKRRGKRRRTAPFVCCAVTLCKLWSYYVLYSGGWCQSEADMPVCLNFFYRQYMEEKKICTMLHCNSIVYFFPTKRTTRNAFFLLLTTSVWSSNRSHL